MRKLPRSRTRRTTILGVEPAARSFRTPLAATISAILATGALPLAAQAAAPADDLPEIIVTATRRAEDIQDIPLNIAAIGGEQLEKQGVTDLAQLGRAVPGLFVIDQGKRTSNVIVVRGLNVQNVGAQDSAGNDAGEIVSTYVGEIPLYIDLSLEDMDRVEVLLGPQGTLYGVGTMGGAIRYIPRRPDFAGSTLTLRGSGYSLAESDDLGAKGGFTVNLPISDVIAFRASLDYLDAPGFIDQPYLVRQAGVSDPEPNFANAAAVAANLRREDDTNFEKTWSGRVGFRIQPEEGIDVNFTHYSQDMEVGGRNINSNRSFGTGVYESANRFLEPNERKNRLTALEVTADLGFAELTSASGYSRYDDDGQRDQTDLLLTFDRIDDDPFYLYDDFPAFSAFTRDTQKDKTISQELRLVSKGLGSWNWIGGLFYNHLDSEGLSREYTPVFDDYQADAFGGIGRPDDLEYISYGTDDLTEKALFGEVGYAITDSWNVTVGARYYKYDYITYSGSDLPVLYSNLGIYGPDEINVELEKGEQHDSGTLFKFNTSYDFTPDLMGYFTLSEGYRIGASNGIAPCDVPPSGNQNVCATPEEMAYFPDKTVNYELGVRSEWLGGALTVNGSVYFIDWEDPQLQSATVLGSQPYTKNGEGAETKGVELSVNALLGQNLTAKASYAYTQAELSAVAPSLIRLFVPPGFGPSGTDALFLDGQPGDRLPGSPEHQATLFLDYNVPLSGSWELGLNYGLAMIGDIITKPGLRASGETLGGYTLHSAGATLSGGPWSLSLYAQNLFNKYAVTGTRSTPLFIQTLTDENGEPVRVRSYGQDVLRPREVGLRFTYNFEF